MFDHVGKEDPALTQADWQSAGRFAKGIATARYANINDAGLGVLSRLASCATGAVSRIACLQDQHEDAIFTSVTKRWGAVAEWSKQNFTHLGNIIRNLDAGHIATLTKDTIKAAVHAHDLLVAGVFTPSQRASLSAKAKALYSAGGVACWIQEALDVVAPLLLEVAPADLVCVDDLQVLAELGKTKALKAHNGTVNFNETAFALVVKLRLSAVLGNVSTWSDASVVKVGGLINVLAPVDFGLLSLSALVAVVDRLDGLDPQQLDAIVGRVDGLVGHNLTTWTDLHWRHFKGIIPTLVMRFLGDFTNIADLAPIGVHNVTGLFTGGQLLAMHDHMMQILGGSLDALTKDMGTFLDGLATSFTPSDLGTLTTDGLDGQ